MAAKVFQIGDNTASDHAVQFIIGGSNPTIKWDAANTQLRFQGDGATNHLSIDNAGDVSIANNLSVTGNVTIDGNLTFGNAATDTITLTADIASNILPSADNTYDIGATGSEWKDLYVDGTAYLDNLQLGSLDQSEHGFINFGANMYSNIDSSDATTTAAFIWGKDATDHSGTELMRLEESGNLGISGALTSTSLDINGAADISGNLTLSSANFLALDVDHHEVIRRSSNDHIMFTAAGIDRWDFNGDNVTRLTMTSDSTTEEAEIILSVPASSSADPQIHLTEGTGGGAANNMGYVVGYDTSANLFRIRSSDTDGSSTDGDVLSIADGTNDVKFAGNVGIGGTVPLAWHADYTSVQIGGNGVINSYTATGANGYFEFSQNAQYDTDGSYEYISTDEAARYRQYNGTHLFGTAPSGTAGNDITFTDRMAITSGGIGIGTEAPDRLLHIQAGDAEMGPAEADSKFILEQDADHIYTEFITDNDKAGGFIWSSSGAKKAWFQYQNDTSNEGYFQIAPGNSASMTWLHNGNVGIGTAAPGNQLEIAKSGGEAILEISSWSTTITDQPLIMFQKSLSAGIGQMVETDEDEILGSFHFQGVNSSNTSGAAARIQIEQDGDSGANFIPGRIKFKTATDSANVADRMVITNNGLVGIGTSTPLGNLHIQESDVSVTPDGDGDNLVVEANGASGISILSSDTTAGKLIFGSASDAVGASIVWYHNSNEMYVGTNHDDATLSLRTGQSTEGIHIDASQCVYIGSTANANMTKGLTIDQGANDDEILALNSSGDIAHGMTNYALTETFFDVLKLHATNGGAFIRGFSEDNTGVRIEGLSTNDNTTKGIAATAPVMILAAKKSGSSAGSVGSDGNLMTIGDRNADTRFIFDVEGSAHADVEWTTYDKHDDVQLLRDIEATMVPEIFGEAVQYREADLIKLGLFGKDSIRRADNGKMRGMMNQTKMVMLHHGAIQKVASALAETRKDLKEAQQKLMRLEAA